MGVTQALQAELTSAMRRRDGAVVAVLRTALAALANAEAAPAPTPVAEPVVHSVHVAGASRGLGATEVERVALDEQQRRAIVTGEAAELAARVEHLTRMCRRDEAGAARRGLGVLLGLVAASA